MFEIGTKVRVNNPKTQSKLWKSCEGTITQIIDAFDSISNKDTKVHIVTLGGGESSPVEVEYLTAI